MRVGVFGRSYAQAWKMMPYVVAVRGDGVGWIVGGRLIGSGDAMGEAWV